jgi:hypothetical protein
VVHRLLAWSRSLARCHAATLPHRRTATPPRGSASEEEFAAMEVFKDRFHDKLADRFNDGAPGMVNALLDVCFEVCACVCVRASECARTWARACDSALPLRS